MEKHPLHLKAPELQTSPEVQRAVEREERTTGGKVPNAPAERIETYVDRLENIFLNPDARKRERNLEMFRDKIYDALIIKRENFPESYFELQKRIARERGQAVEEIPPDVRERMIDTVIEDQKHSLDAIIEYLSSNDATYPAWFKYYAWTQLTKLSQFDKERGEFKKRTDSTVAPFPALHYGPLAAIADLYERVKDDNKDSEARREFDKKFPTLYAELIAKSLAETVENREEIRGEWVKYKQGDTNAAETLFQSLKGRGTGWCTADGRTTAETQIESGDFYVYYTNDLSGEPTQPRLAIRMDGNSKIGEVRGILPHQGVEPLMQDVLDQKLSEFGNEADNYRKKSEDMRMLTALEKKRENNEPFTKDDLVLLYEINGTIDGFGYEKDPRIAELRQGRNIEEDMAVMFECTRDQIARTTEEVNENTRAYVGEWNPEVCKTIRQFSNIQHLYESFLEKKIFIMTLETDPRINSLEKAEEALMVKNIYFDKSSKDILYKTKFSQKKTYELVKFTVKQLGLPEGVSTVEIYQRANELGLELCPAEVGLYLRLQYTGKELMIIAMKQIINRDGSFGVFILHADGDRLELYGNDVNPKSEWYSGNELVFRFREPSLSAKDGGKQAKF